MERVSGIEPPSHPWQGRIITVIQHPQKLNCLDISNGYNNRITAF